MKTFVIIAIILVVVFALVGGVAYKADREHKADLTAQLDLDKQFATRWQTVVQSYELLGKSCSSKDEYRDFCRDKYKGISGLAQFEVKPEFAGKLQPQVETFADKVIYPAKEMFNLMSDPITGDPDQLRDIVSKARDLETKMNQYWESHRQLQVVPKKADGMKSLLSKFYQPKPVEPPKVVVIHEYPDWIRSDVQRQAFTSMRTIASRYFVARSTLQKQINWKYGSENQVYFGNPGVRSVLFDAIELRKSLFSEVQDAKRVEGMTELADKLETMLRNSYQGLLALYNNQDYNTFKQLNNQNDQISRYVRTVFGVR